MPRLPVLFFAKQPLFKIASLIGTPLRLDSATSSLKRPGVARIQVEIDLLKDRTSQVWIGMGSADGFWQQIEYENVPSYCTHCWHVGHSELVCHVHNPELKPRQKPGPATKAPRQEYRAKVVAAAQDTIVTQAVVPPEQAFSVPKVSTQALQDAVVSNQNPTPPASSATTTPHTVAPKEVSADQLLPHAPQDSVPFEGPLIFKEVGMPFGVVQEFHDVVPPPTSVLSEYEYPFLLPTTIRDDFLLLPGRGAQKSSPSFASPTRAEVFQQLRAFASSWNNASVSDAEQALVPASELAIVPFDNPATVIKRKRGRPPKSQPPMVPLDQRSKPPSRMDTRSSGSHSTS